MTARDSVASPPPTASLMSAWRLEQPGALDDPRLTLAWRSGLPLPQPGPGDLLLRVRVCGVCHTDLHIVEGEVPAPRLPITPGHQVVGTVEAVAGRRALSVPVPAGVAPTVAAVLLGSAGRPAEAPRRWHIASGARVGVPWLFASCGRCPYCRAGQENLCDAPLFTGLHRDGGFAQYMVARRNFLVPLPASYSDEEAAPLLCAGIIGYRALRVAGVNPAGKGRLGLYGFGASAHLALPLAVYWGYRVYVFSRSPEHRALADQLGASWTGLPDELPPQPLDAAISFAPVGSVLPLALRALRKGGILAVNAVYLDQVPAIPYALLYGERRLQSVANATRQDAWEWMYWAAEANIRPTVESYPAPQLPVALRRLKAGQVQGSAVLRLAGD